MRYFPFAIENIGAWIKSYGKYVVEGYLPAFKDFPYTFNNMQFFNIVTYSRKVEMTKMGKYMTPVIA